MERDSHYFVVGLFVIVTAIAGALFAGLFYDQPYTATNAYEVHFDTPVLGLEPGSEVRYMGIKKGEVTRVFLLPDDPAQVGVAIAVETDTPVNTATIATLQQQGLTGVPFLNLEQDGSITPAPLTVSKGADLPIISTRRTPMDAFVESLPSLEQKLSALVQAATEVLNPENRQNFAGLLANMNKISASLPALATNLEQTNSQLQELIQHVDTTVTRSGKALDADMQELQATLVSIRSTSQRLDKLLADVDRVVLTNEGKVNELLGEGGESLKQLLNESRKTAAVIRQLGDKLGQNPSQIIYQPAPQGTELPR
ncbi:MAG: MCE family protein [Gammaproteobacteria bacterium]|nr:MCE family protein [Gammaproteobacteria bacterium]MBU1722331.1 MCE family protein [Gammaproteobacteria bacterium]MBU2004732.1 MCE family protein [Gammaproteobacteria bacterium]